MINQSKRLADIADKNLLGYANFVEFSLLVIETIDVINPINFKKSISSAKRDRWIDGMGEEIVSLKRN